MVVGIRMWEWCVCSYPLSSRAEFPEPPRGEVLKVLESDMTNATRSPNRDAISLSKQVESGGGSFPIRSGAYWIIPGLCDVHVHLREPGYFYKESIATGSRAGAHGGYTALCAMPNLDPAPDSTETLRVEADIIRRDAVIPVLPYGTITKGERGEELADMEGLAPHVCAFSDDGRGVQDAGMMREAMQRAYALGKIIAAHCEDNSLLHGGYIHDGRYAREHGHRGICSASEYRQIERDLQLVADTGVAYHVCHISTRESVELIRQAKASGLDVTCETAPHYLVLCEDDLQEHGRFKMNPPLRSADDRAALLEGLLDGTIDMIATDHAPHSAEEKSRGLSGSPFGITGLETAFPVLYTELVLGGVMTMETLIERMSLAPRKRFSIPLCGEDYAVFEVETPYTICPESFLSKGKSTPFAGRTVYGKCIKTVTGGKTVWQEDSTES